MVVPSTRESLNKDVLTSYILRDKAMQEAKKSAELLPQVKYVPPTKQGGRPRQHGKPGGGGSGGGKPAKDADKGKSAKDIGRGGGSRCQECWPCGDPDHLSFELLDHDDSDDDDTKGGRGRRRGCNVLAGRRCRADRLAGAQAAAAVQASPAVVLLDGGCSHHLMGTKDAFVDLGPSGAVKHVRGYNGALQDVQGCGNVALIGEARKQVLIPDVLYVPGVQENLLSAGQL
ncbi:unnamed protein product [Closterium sp. NIES-53]